MRPLLIAASAWLSLAVATTLIPDSAVGDVFLFAIVVFSCWIALAILALFLSVQCFCRKAWLSVVVCLAVPVVAPLAAYGAIPYVQYPADYAHFQSSRSWYDAEVAQLPKDGKRYAEFNWGGMSFASRGVVYDETDEVALPYGRQSTDWKKRMKSSDLTCGGEGPIGEVRHLAGHYYVATFGC